MRNATLIYMPTDEQVQQASIREPRGPSNRRNSTPKSNEQKSINHLRCAPRGVTSVGCITEITIWEGYQLPRQKSGFSRRRRWGWTASTAALSALGASLATMQRPAFADAAPPTAPPVVEVNGTPWVQVSSAAQLEYIDLNQTAAISAGSSTPSDSLHQRVHCRPDGQTT
jgi:hypothetical protein